MTDNPRHSLLALGFFVAGIIAILGYSLGSWMERYNSARSVEKTESVISPEISTVELVIEDESYYHFLSHEISSFYYAQGIRVDTVVVWEVIDEASKYLKKKIPNGPFVLADMLTIASHEGNFRMDVVGKHGEIGTFQILKPQRWASSVGAVASDAKVTRVNTRMGVQVLLSKYKTHKNYQKSIIAYNGVVRNKDGVWDKKYWDLFVSRKKKIKALMNRAEKRYKKELHNRIKRQKKG